MLLVNKETFGPPSQAADAVAARYALYASRIGAPSTTDRIGYDADLAIALANFGGDWESNPANPTRFVRTTASQKDLAFPYFVPHPDSEPLSERRDAHFWLTDGIEAAKTWINGDGSQAGFLEEVENRKTSGQLPAIPTRLILDTELPVYPTFSGPQGAPNSINQVRRMKAMLNEPRGNELQTDLSNVIPYKSPTGLLFRQWFVRSISTYAQPPYGTNVFPIDPSETWLKPDGSNWNYDEDAGDLGFQQNRQFGQFMERLWHVQLDGAFKYSLIDPMHARPGWQDCLSSNYGWSFHDTDYSTYPGTGPLPCFKPVRSGDYRPNGGPPFRFGWHFVRTTNSILENPLIAARENYIGQTEIRNEGSASVGRWTSAGFRRIDVEPATSFKLMAPGMYTISDEHRSPNLYAPPAAAPYGRYQDSVQWGPLLNAPLETFPEALERRQRSCLKHRQFP
jgi:hypothetical protein